jgi:hypothetical protein
MAGVADSNEFQEVFTVRKLSVVDGLYVFTEEEDRDLFATACRANGAEIVTGSEPLNGGEGAARLIAAERGDALENLGFTALAEDIREGLEPATALHRLRETVAPTEAKAAATLIAEWIQ